MRDLIRRYAQHQRDVKNGKVVVPCRLYTPKQMTRITAPEEQKEFAVESAERPMTKKQIYKLDRDGVMADAREFGKAKTFPVHYWLVGGKRVENFTSCDGTKQKIVTRDVVVECAR